jgi:integrase
VNVARLSTPPKRSTVRVVPPTADQVRQIIETTEQRDPTVAAFLMLAALTGARRGELCALRWTDVDLELGRVTISRAIIHVGGGRLVEKDTKTHAERTLSLGHAGVTLLRLHWDTIAGRARTAGTYVQPAGYVFSRNLNCATPISPDAVTAQFTRVRDELGLKHRFTPRSSPPPT